MQLGVTTKLKIDEQIKNQTKLSYTDGENKESLPSSHNGLGYKNLIKISSNLKEEDIKDFHTKMWIFCHGIATLVANGTIKLTDNQIQDLLSYEFQALMLLEENPNNKWVLNKKEENK